jgi:hypothetical protein
MTTPSMLVLAALPVIAAGIALSAFAQHDSEPAAAVEKMVIEASFAQADADGDGGLSADEAAALPVLATQFDTLDKDHDHRLDLQEFAQGVATLG